MAWAANGKNNMAWRSWNSGDIRIHQSTNIVGLTSQAAILQYYRRALREGESCPPGETLRKRENLGKKHGV